MGQKVNPHGLRVGVIKDWDSRWFASDETFGDTLVSDYKVRKALKAKLMQAGVPKIEIERNAQNVRVFIHCAKPGMIIGREGAEINKLSSYIESIVGKPVKIEIIEVRSPDLNAQLVAESIASQLERRIGFRRAMKQAIGRTMKLGAKGIKISVGGRLGGAEIARTEHYHEGTIPLQTLRADIEYGFWEASTTYGKIGVKVWIYKGEVLNDSKRRGSAPAEAKTDRRDRRDRRDRSDRGDRAPRGERTGDRDNRGFGGRGQGGGRFGGRDRNEAPRNNYAGSNRIPGAKKPAAAPVAEAPAAESETQSKEE